MLLSSFEFGSTRQQYTAITVVPAESCQPDDKLGDESVDKPVRLGTMNGIAPKAVVSDNG
jgi:hypothetical protein